MMSLETCKSLIGASAAVCSTGMLVPQLIKMRRFGARDLSYQMLFLYLAGVVLWLMYGILMHSLPLIISNAPAACLAIACIATKRRFDRVPQS
jgi:MtN3 and saliva related transmembrane protein